MAATVQQPPGGAAHPAQVWESPANRRAAVRPPGRWGAPAATCLSPGSPGGGGAALGGWPEAGGGLGLRGGARAWRSPPPPPTEEVLAGALRGVADAVPLSGVSRPRAGDGPAGSGGRGCPWTGAPGDRGLAGARLAAGSGLGGLVGRVPYGGECGGAVSLAAAGARAGGRVMGWGLAAGPGVVPGSRVRGSLRVGSRGGALVPRSGLAGPPLAPAVPWRPGCLTTR